MLTLILIPSYLFAQNSPPGIYKSFDDLISIHKENYEKNLEQASARSSQLNNLKDPKSATLDKDFLNTILFYTPSRYLALGSKDKCSFYDLLFSNLLRTNKGELNYLIINYTDSNGTIRKSYVNKNTFINKIASVQCPSSLKFRDYFQLQNLKKTLSKSYLKPPTDYGQCYKEHTRLLEDHKTPYLCHINDQIISIKKIKNRIARTKKTNTRTLSKLKKALNVALKYRQILNKNSRSYLNNFCENIEKPQLFCSEFFEQSFWKKVTSTKNKKIYAEAICKNLQIKDSKSRNMNCSKMLQKFDTLCLTPQNLDSSMLPRANCNSLSTALNFSRLKSDYYDCPAEIRNESILHTSRLVAHLNPSAVESANKIKDCDIRATDRFYGFNFEANEGSFWGIKLCYYDRINLKDVCIPSLFGDVEKKENSLSQVVATILSRTKGFNPKNKCRTVSAKEYNPKFLEYRSGCFIVKNMKECSAVDCKFDIVLDDVKMKHVKVQNDFSFDFYPQKFMKENLSQMKLLERHFLAKGRRLDNITILKDTLKTHSKAIIHGIGCREDLIPSFFNKRNFNQCTPTFFIIDSYFEDKGITSLSIRLSYDSLQAPRILSWSNIFTAITNYKKQHPVSMWGLYAIY